MSTTPIILFSGMGADERVFAAQKAAFPDLIVPRWITPLRNETLEAYARRFAAVVDPGRPCFIGGASFGGFVAIEAARHLSAPGCILIGSVRSPGELPRRIRLLRPAAALAQLMPFEAAIWFAGLAAAYAPCLHPGSRLFLQQAADSDAAFLRWAARAVLTWRGGKHGREVPVHQIHGACDHVLPASLTRPDVIVPGAGHVLPLTHAEAVKQFLRQCISQHGGYNDS